MNNWEEEFADNLMYKWGGVMRAKEKEKSALKWVNNLLAKHLSRAVAKERKELLDEVKEIVGSERDKGAKTTKQFNKLDDYSEGYWIAMNTILKKLEELK